MVKSADCFPSFGVFQGFDNDSLAKVQQAAQIAYTGVAQHFCKVGIDPLLINPRSVFGFTLTSLRDVRTASEVLVEDGFDFATFRQGVERVAPHFPDDPVVVTSGKRTNRSCAWSVGVGLHKSHVSSLTDRARVIRQVADETGGLALPMRVRFSHLSLLTYGNHKYRPSLPASDFRRMKEIIMAAKNEVGLRDLYLGRLIIGKDIDTPLPERSV